MVRDVKPFTYVEIPRWLNLKVIDAYCKKHGVTRAEARNALFREENPADGQDDRRT